MKMTGAPHGKNSTKLISILDTLASGVLADDDAERSTTAVAGGDAATSTNRLVGLLTTLGHHGMAGNWSLTLKTHVCRLEKCAPKFQMVTQ